MDLSPINHLPNPSSPLTVPESLSETELSPLKSILKGSINNHTVVPTTSDISPLEIKKKISWGTTSEKSLPTANEGLSIEDVTTSHKDPTTPNKFILRKSEEIAKWADNLTTLRKQEAEESKGLLKVFLQENRGMNKNIMALIEKKVALRQNEFTKAKAYAKWANIRHSLISGDKEVEQRIEERGYSIDSNWNSQELNEDWEQQLQEPWANENSTSKEINQLISEARSQSKSVKKEKYDLPEKRNTDSPSSFEDYDYAPYSQNSDIAPRFARHPLNPDGTPNSDIILDMHGSVMREPHRPADNTCTIS